MWWTWSFNSTIPVVLSHVWFTLVCLGALTLATEASFGLDLRAYSSDLVKKVLDICRESIRVLL